MKLWLRDWSPPGKLPTCTLGRTGIKVPILGFGSGSRFLMYKDEDKAIEALNRAIESGRKLAMRQFFSDHEDV